MKFTRKELLAAVAATALIATGGGLSAQEQTKPGGTTTEAQGGAKAGGTQMQTQGGAKSSGGQVQTQGGAQMKSGQGGTQAQGGAKTGQSGPNQPGEAGEKVGAEPGGPGNRAPGQAQQPGADQKSGTQAQQPSDADKPAQLSETQRSQISTTLKKQGNLRRVERNDINFTINVGAVVPRTVNLAPLPAPILAVVPAYRGYLYIVVGADLLIVHPRTYEIVAVIPA